MENIKLYVGFDQREAIAYHVFVQSVIANSSVHIEVSPLAKNLLEDYKETHKDNSNDFIYSRFLVPYLNGFEGWAIFADGDMICNEDLLKLWKLRDKSMAVQVVKHEYKTKAQKKYMGNVNEDYPRKNWSSLIIWNCSHPKHKILTPDFIRLQTGSFLHRFTWLNNDEIGALPIEWNWLAIEYPINNEAKLIHYTLGTPCFIDYKNTDMSDIWEKYYSQLNQGMNSR